MSPTRPDQTDADAPPYHVACTDPHDGFKLPAYATDDACALDLVAAYPRMHEDGSRWGAVQGDASHAHGAWVVPAGGRCAVRTAVAGAIPPGHFGLVTVRSGFAFRYGLQSHPGKVDADYRGEVLVLLFNGYHHDEVVIEPGDRFAQLAVVPYRRVRVVRVAPGALEAMATGRGAGGFGSTGV
jgi:deoxyuridine 5'-triphosphate nucleotidohydrolase